MYTRIVFFSVLLLSFVAHATTVVAQDIASSSSSTTEPLPPSPPTTIISPGPDTANKSLSTASQRRIINLAANISNRQEAAIGRLLLIANRLTTRLDKLNSTGTDTAAARTYVTDATLALSNARLLLASIDTEVVQATTSNTPIVAWVSIESIYRDAAINIRDAKAALEIAVSLAKNSTPLSTNTSTTTSTTTP